MRRKQIRPICSLAKRRCPRSFMRHAAISGMFFLIVTPVALWAQPDLDEAIAAMTAKLSEKVHTEKTVAVLNFTNLQGAETELGRFLAEEFSISLMNSSESLRVVDRSRVDFLLKEHGLKVSGLVDPSNAIQLGKVAGIQALVTGTITPYGNNLRLTVKVIDIETASILAAAREEIARTETLTSLEKKPIIESATTSGPDRAHGTRIGEEVAADDAGRVITEGAFTFRLLKCERKGEEVTCHINVTSDKDADYDVGGGCRIIANSGVVYAQNRLALGTHGAYTGRTSTRLVAGIPTRISLTVRGVDADVRLLALVELTSNVQGVRFRDIPVE